VCRIDEEKETTWDMCEGMIMIEKEAKLAMMNLHEHSIGHHPKPEYFLDLMTVKWISYLGGNSPDLKRLSSTRVQA
jgi:hypothetical protein